MAAGMGTRIRGLLAWLWGALHRVAGAFPLWVWVGASGLFGCALTNAPNDAIAPG